MSIQVHNKIAKKSANTKCRVVINHRFLKKNDPVMHVNVESMRLKKRVVFCLRAKTHKPKLFNQSCIQMENS